MKGCTCKALMIAMSLMTITACGSSGPVTRSVSPADAHKLSIPVDNGNSSNPLASYAVFPGARYFAFLNVDTGESFGLLHEGRKGSGFMLLEPGEYIFQGLPTWTYVPKKVSGKAEETALVASQSMITANSGSFYQPEGLSHYNWQWGVQFAMVAVEQIIYVKARLEGGKYYAITSDNSGCHHSSSVRVSQNSGSCRVSVLELDPNRFEILDGGRKMTDREPLGQFLKVEERSFYVREIARVSACEKEKCYTKAEISDNFRGDPLLWKFD